MKGVPIYASAMRVFNEGFTKKGDFRLKNAIFYTPGLAGRGMRGILPGGRMGIFFRGGVLIYHRIT
jgi:hypothetical protein